MGGGFRPALGAASALLCSPLLCSAPPSHALPPACHTPPPLRAAGSEADAAAACALFAVPDCQTLAAPVFRAAQTAVLSNCKSRAVVGGGAGGKKEKDPAEAMTQVINTGYLFR